MSYLLRPILGIISLSILIPHILLMNFFQAMSVFLIPFSPKLMREVNRFCSGSWFGLLNFCVQHILGVEIVRTGETLPKKEDIFLISNHQAMADVPVLLSVACECQRQQDLKWFVKDPIKWVPGIGWGMLFMDCLFVKRNWMADKEKVTKTFSRLKKNKSPFWVISFAEGTRITPKKQKQSQAFGKKMNLPHLENVMLPRTKGFEATLEGLDTIEAIYDITIGYEKSPPHLLELFFTPIKRMHVNVQRFPISSIPSTNEGRSAWVIERFVEKDRKLTGFKKSGHF